MRFKNKALQPFHLTDTSLKSLVDCHNLSLIRARHKTINNSYLPEKDDANER